MALYSWIELVGEMSAMWRISAEMNPEERPFLPKVRAPPRDDWLLVNWPNGILCGDRLVGPRPLPPPLLLLLVLSPPPSRPTVVFRVSLLRSVSNCLSLWKYLELSSSTFSERWHKTSFSYADRQSGGDKLKNKTEPPLLPFPSMHSYVRWWWWQ